MNKRILGYMGVNWRIGSEDSSFRLGTLTLPSRRRPKGRFAPFAPRLMSNVVRQ